MLESTPDDSNQCSARPNTEMVCSILWNWNSYWNWKSKDVWPTLERLWIGLLKPAYLGLMCVSI